MSVNELDKRVAVFPVRCDVPGARMGYARWLKLMLMLVLVAAGIAAFRQFGHQGAEVAGVDEPPAWTPVVQTDVLDGQGGRRVADERKETVGQVIAGAATHDAVKTGIPVRISAGRIVESSLDDNDAVSSRESVAGLPKRGDAVSSAAIDEYGPVQQVLHITNIGDRIIITDETNTVISSYAAFHRDRDSTGAEAGYADDASNPVSRPADFEEAYPGCPNALPEGSDEQDAAWHLEYYGCRYRRSCAADTDERRGSCTWYFTGKI